jgi:hypothetical protein
VAQTSQDRNHWSGHRIGRCERPQMHHGRQALSCRVNAASALGEVLNVINIKGHGRLAQVVKGVKFKDGLQEEAHKVAA